MSRILKERTPIAQKDYPCDASHFLIEYMRDCEFSFSELRIIAKAKKQDWRIRKGDRYFYQVNTIDGDFGVFRAIEGLHKICIDHELYDLS